MDISEQCGHSLEEQIELFNGIKPLFANKPLLVVLNKVDVVRPEELGDEKQDLLKAFDQEGEIRVYDLGVGNNSYLESLFMKLWNY